MKIAHKIRDLEPGETMHEVTMAVSPEAAEAVLRGFLARVRLEEPNADIIMAHMSVTVQFHVAVK